MIGMENIKHYISTEGSIGAGKSTFLAALRKYIAKHRLDATEASHIDADDLTKDYYLIVDEPVDEWTKENYTNEEGQKISMLGAFYSDIKGMSFPFQIYTFTTRMRRLRDTLNRVVPTNFPRRIHIISERSMRSDRLFFENLCQHNDAMKLQWAIYEEFFALICDEVLKRQDALIYLPVNSKVCHSRIERRSRLQETENNISEAYLAQLDDKHTELINEFKAQHKRVFQLDEFKNDMSSDEIDAVVEKTMRAIGDFVAC